MGLYTICEELITEISEEIKGNDAAIGTGYHDLDVILRGGFRDGMLYVLASRPGMGKSNLAINMAMNILGREAKKIIYFNVESTTRQLLYKMICLEARIEPGVIKEYSDEERDAIDKAASRVAGMQLMIDDTEDLDIDELYGVMSDPDRKDADLIIIDYLQLMTSAWDISGEQHSGRDAEMEYICRKLKVLAKKLDIPILVLSQLSKDVDLRDDRCPGMSDFIEPLGMDTYADVVIFLYRDEYYNDDSELRGIADINVLKNHFGKSGKCRLVYISQLMLFANMARN